MKYLATIAVLLAGAGSALAQDAPPDVTGVWTGAYTSVVFGNNAHHSQIGEADPQPRIVQIDWTFDLQGQEGTAVWGANWSDPSLKDMTAFSFASDNKTLYGADSDGFHRLELLSEDRMEACFTMNGQSPTGSIVAGCVVLERQPK